ncbi:pentatricopeptide repeat-containing protein [Acrasis kona]|uniref:Pentatricopeptide repeat-containing protein n=1 Tax=Acrasis kona TaxID=1008807 RepID=A0AAW2ZPQ3_9EUKA
MNPVFYTTLSEEHSLHKVDHDVLNHIKTYLADIKSGEKFTGNFSNTVLNQIIQTNFMLDSDECTRLVTFYRDSKYPEHLIRLFEYLSSSPNFQFDEKLYTAFLEAASNIRTPKTSSDLLFDVYKHMKLNQVLPNIKQCNLLLTTSLSPDLVVNVFNELLNQNIAYDRETFSYVLNLCTDRRFTLPELSPIIEYMQEKIQDPSEELSKRDYSALLLLCGRTNKTEYIIPTLNTIDPSQLNLSTFNVALNACASANDITVSEQVLNLIKEKRMKPNTQTFNIFIKMYSKTSRLEKIMSIMHLMVSLDLELDNYTFAEALNACADAHDLKTADEVLTLMRKYAKRPNVRVYTAIIKLYVNTEKFDQIIPVLEHMIREERLPNKVTLEIVLKGLAKSKHDPRIGQDLLNLIEEHNLTSGYTLIKHDVLLEFLGKTNRLEQLVSTVQMMIMKGIKCTEYTFSIAINACAEACNAELGDYLVSLMKQYIEPNEVLYCTMIKLYCKTGRRDMATSLFDEVEEQLSFKATGHAAKWLNE